MSTFLEIAVQIGELVEQKNAAYGSSFADAGEFLKLLYPQGVTPEQYDDALLIVRIFDKLKRIATNNDPSGENPYRDIAGYGILGARLKVKAPNAGEMIQCASRTQSHTSTNVVDQDVAISFQAGRSSAATPVERRSGKPGRSKSKKQSRIVRTAATI